MSDNSSAKVAIVIPTRDRSEFMIRQLRYYARLRSPHPVYIVDSSNQDHARLLKETVDSLKNKLDIFYFTRPPGMDPSGFLFLKVKEKYACFCGDDDFQIPSSLTKCAEYLDRNPDYASAGGRAVCVYFNGAYTSLKEIKRIADYPRFSFEDELPSQRLLGFLKNYETTTFSVNRVEYLKGFWDKPRGILDSMTEIIPSCLCIVAGKSKVLDRLGFVRQNHNQQFAKLPDTFDLITGKNWYQQFSDFKERIIYEVRVREDISEEEILKIIKEGWLILLAKWISKDRDVYSNFIHPDQIRARAGFKQILAVRFPFLKKLYQKIKPLFPHKKWLHAEVLNPQSSYYQDFKPVLESIEDKINRF